MALEFTVRGGRVAGPKPAPLQSEWGGLNENLICSITAVDRDGDEIPGEPTVLAALSEGATLSGQLNWQSPFEAMSPETRAPALAALAQSGALIGAASNSDATAVIKNLRGRAGLTRINSTQIFSGMAPVKLSCTLLFRAWRDPMAEVMTPLQKVWEWAVPQVLAPDSLLVATLKGTGGRPEPTFPVQSRVGQLFQSAALSLLPSVAPQLVQFRYAGRLFDKMVIESIEEPLTSSRDRNGNYTELALPITLATLTALDRQDVAAQFQGQRDPARGRR